MTTRSSPTKKVVEMVGISRDGYFQDTMNEQPETFPNQSHSNADNNTTAATEENPTSLLPPVSETQIDDANSMNIAFISMHQLLNNTTNSLTTATDNPNESGGLEPSIVSGTTDLFEGDLGDDELPSIMMPSGGGENQFENLQLNPVDLVEEVQEEVQQQAAADPDGPALLAAAVVDATLMPQTSPKLLQDIQELPISEPHQRPPVVPFVKVRKLSNAEAITNKRPAAAPMANTPAKKTRAAEASKGHKPTPRMTRSRVKKTGTDVIANGLSPKTRAKKDRATKASDSPKTTSLAKEPTAMETEAIPSQATPTRQISETLTTAPKPQRVPSAAAEVVVSDSGSVTGSIASATEIIREDTESVQAKLSSLPTVTPVVSQEVASSKQLDLARMVESVSILLPSLSAKGTTTGGPAEHASALKEAATGLKPSPGKDVTPSTKKTSSKRSSSKAKNAAARTTSSSKAIPLSAVAIDTSTDHIKALTGENGASVCLSVRSCTELQIEEDIGHALSSEKSDSPTPEKSTATSSSSVPLTEEERVQQSRDRNRRHARNTRLRKKAYVEELKQTLNELVAQRDRSVATQEQNRQRELEQREVRFRVMEEFLRLRGRNEADAKRWSAILLPPFSMTMPHTPFQEMVGASIVGGEQQELTGVEQVMQESCHFAAFLQTMGKNNSDATDAKVVSLVYHCDREDFMMDGCRAALGWKATSTGATEEGASSELTFHGTIRASFCPESNRLRSTELMFDTGTIATQRDAMQS